MSMRTVLRFFGVAIFAIAICAHAQTYSVLHTFTGGADGAQPWAGVTVDSGGNLYGTATEGAYTGGNCSPNGCGTAYKLKRSGTGWTFSTLYTFHDSDGAFPYAPLIFGPDGALYGTTNQGGVHPCCGAVFSLRPPATFCSSVVCPWVQNLLWSFDVAPDGNDPFLGAVTFDAAGHIFGTTTYGGNYYQGTAFELQKQPSGGWTENILFNFGLGGQQPYNNLIFDSSGNIYTTTEIGGADNAGAVVELVNSPSGWTENDIYSFTGASDGSYPYAGLIFDQAGNLYGTTRIGGANNDGTVFELTPSNGSWTFHVIYDGGGWSGLTMDAAGNLYGTFGSGAYGNGAVSKLTPSNGSWIYTPLYSFTGGSDGGGPVGGVAFDANGNLYGTTASGGNLSDCQGYGCGVVWELTP